jgi:TRAP-type C4-dicarboxylate transport system substrate-binding protein
VIEVGIVFGAKAWNSLSAAQRDFLNRQIPWIEAMNADMAGKDVAVDLKRQADAGIQTIRLPDDEAKKLLAIAQESAWAGILASTGANGPRLKQMMAP